MPLKLSEPEVPNLNLTPMLDVVFNLMIFFMVSTQFVDLERSLDVKLPTASDAGPITAAPARRVVNVLPGGQVVLDRQSLTIEQLRARLTALRQEYPALGVLIRGDGQVSLQEVTNVLAACRAAGIAELGISVRVAEGEKVPATRNR